MRPLLLIITIGFSLLSFAEGEASIIGSWKGIDVFQDENSYDGKTFYLPNNETILIEQNKLKTYYYPYSKIDEFQMTIQTNQIRYKMDRGYTESRYKVSGDTLRLEMHFINKVFVKVYKRTEVDKEIIAELDQYGFNPSSLVHEFELDTLHPDQYNGFDHYDSLSFSPFRYIQFMSDERIRLNRSAEIEFERTYHKVSFTWEGSDYTLEVNHAEGTQRFYIVPVSQCNCSELVLPYITVSWADRIREAIRKDLEDY